MVDISPALTSSLKGISKDLTKELRQAAISAKWPANLANVLRVTVDNSGIKVTYPNKVAKEIEDLEYGTQSTPPKPVFRTFISKYEKALSSIMTESSVNDLFAKGVLP